MPIVMTDGQVPATFEDALADGQWRRAFGEYLRGLGRDAASLLESYDKIVRGRGPTTGDELTSFAYGAQLSERTRQLVAGAYHQHEIDRALAAMRADVMAQGEDLYPGFAARAEEVLARIVDPKRLRSLNEELLKATDAGVTLHWQRVGDVLYLTERAAASTQDERHIFFERNADETGTLEVVSRGRGTNPGSVRVTGTTDPIWFKATLREFTKKKIDFDDGGGLLDDPDDAGGAPSRVKTAEQLAAEDAAAFPPRPAPTPTPTPIDTGADDASGSWPSGPESDPGSGTGSGEYYADDSSGPDASGGGYDNAAEEGPVPPPTLEEAWTSEWAPTFIEWARQQDPVYDCLEAVNEYKSSGSPEYRDLILQNVGGAVRAAAPAVARGPRRPGGHRGQHPRAAGSSRSASSNSSCGSCSTSTTKPSRASITD